MKKNENSINFKDNFIKLITNPKEYKYITILKGLKISNGHYYSYVSKYGHVIFESYRTVSLLSKCFEC